MTAAALPPPLPTGDADGASHGALIARTGHSTASPDLVSQFLDLLASPETRRHYGRALVEFAQWRLLHHQTFDAAGVAAWRNELAQGKAPSTVNQKLSALKRLAREAAARGRMSATEAAQIDAVAGVRQLGNRSGNWLTQAQTQALIEAPEPKSLKGKRDRCALALLVGCGLRRDEAVRLNLEDVQQREGRWVIPDLRGKHGRIRTIPVPSWVKVAVDRWAEAAQISTGRILRGMNRHGQITHDSLSGQAVLDLAEHYGREIGVEIRPHDLRRTCAKLCRTHGGQLEQIQLLLGHASIQTTERYLGTKQDLTNAPNDQMGLTWKDR